MDYSELTMEIVRRGSGGDRDAEEVYLIFEPPFEKFDASAVWEEFTGLLRHDKETEWTGSYVIDEHRRIDEGPGASGFWWELLLHVGYTIPATVIAYGAKVAFDRLADRLGIRDIPPLNRETALNTARWAILKRTPTLEGKELGEPIGEEHVSDSQRWTFKFRPGNGYEYAVEVGWHSKVPGVVRMNRTELDP